MTDCLVISTETGKVRGKIENDYHGGLFYSFTGIPYAKAPINDLRFKAPQPAEPWNGIWDGTKEGWESPSILIPTTFQIGKEDNCLNLNVFIKELPSNKESKKPVMVFFHGGCFTYGSNRNYLYGAHNLLTEDIVLVLPNYRLGVLGFLSLEDPSLGAPGNAGLKDQVMALKWVQKNIHNFGGDANNVTIFGQSAGSSSVHYLLLSPLTKGLFHKAILQSGVALNPWAIGRRNYKDIANLMGYNTNIDEKAVFEKLSKASVKSIIKAQFKMDDPFFASMVRPFGPVIEYPHDGAFLTEDPESLMQAGKFHHVPIIIGYTSLEGFMFELLRKTQNDITLPNNLEKDIPFTLNIEKGTEKSIEMAEKLKQFYYKDEDISEKNIDIRYTLFGDIIFVHGIQKTISLFKRYNKCPVYVYKITLTSSLSFFRNACLANHHYVYAILTALISGLGRYCLDIFKSLIQKLIVKEMEGASHADEVFYIFTNAFTPYVTKDSEEDIYIQRFIKLWTNFAKCGDPTPESLTILNSVKWKPIYSLNIDNILEIGKKLGIIGNSERERMDFLSKLYEQYSNKF